MGLLMIELLVAFMGLSGGIIVGIGIFAFFTVLGIIPRIINLGKIKTNKQVYSTAILMGTSLSTAIYIYGIRLGGGKCWLIIAGLFMGSFVGMVASALAEVLNVIPFLTISLRIRRWLYFLLLTIIGGKVLGSLLYWILPGFY